jgi:hypothetical protein
MARSRERERGVGPLLFRPGNEGRRSDPSRRPATFMRRRTLYSTAEAQKKCGLREDLTWYQVTRHTLASQWVLEGVRGADGEEWAENGQSAETADPA